MHGKVTRKIAASHNRQNHFTHSGISVPYFSKKSYALLFSLRKNNFFLSLIFKKKRHTGYEPKKPIIDWNE